MLGRLLALLAVTIGMVVTVAATSTTTASAATSTYDAPALARAYAHPYADTTALSEAGQSRLGVLREWSATVDARRASTTPPALGNWLQVRQRRWRLTRCPSRSTAGCGTWLNRDGPASSRSACRRSRITDPDGPPWLRPGRGCPPRGERRDACSHCCEERRANLASGRSVVALTGPMRSSAGRCYFDRRSTRRSQGQDHPGSDGGSGVWVSSPPRWVGVEVGIER